MYKVKPVIVKWADAFHIPAASAWVYKEALTKVYERAIPYVYTAGFIVKKTKTYLLVAQSFDPVSGLVHSSSIYIPRDWVAEIIEVKV